MHNTSSQQVRLALLIQLIATIVACLLLLLIDQTIAWSALTGGMIASIGNVYVAWKVFAGRQESEPEKILASFYRAEVGKIILTVMLFTGAIVLIKPLNMLILIGAYLVVQFIPWLTSYAAHDESHKRRAMNGR